jgi:hypothetical protein
MEEPGMFLSKYFPLTLGDQMMKNFVTRWRHTQLGKGKSGAP